MLEVIRSTLLMGLGAGVITKEKAEQAVRGLVEQGKLSKEEAERLAAELVASGNEQLHEVQAGLRDSVRGMLDSADIARAGDVDRIARGLENLSQRVSMLEDALRRLEGSPVTSEQPPAATQPTGPPKPVSPPMPTEPAKPTEPASPPRPLGDQGPATSTDPASP